MKIGWWKVRKLQIEGSKFAFKVFALIEG